MILSFRHPVRPRHRAAGRLSLTGWRHRTPAGCLQPDELHDAAAFRLSGPCPRLLWRTGTPSAAAQADAARARAAAPSAAVQPGQARHAVGDAGFTLLEILVVIAILGLLIGLVAPAALRQLGGARNSVAKQSIERISSVLDLYKLDIGSYPTTEQGLAALVQKPSGAANWNGPYLKGDGVPADPWNHPYVYRAPSERAGREFDLCSMGANPNAGSSGMICNP